MRGVHGVPGAKYVKNRDQYASSSGSDSEHTIEVVTDEEDLVDGKPPCPVGRDEFGHLKAFLEKEDAAGPDDVGYRFFAMESEDLLSTMGLSGMSLMCGCDKDFAQMICLALQSFSLQYIILYQFIHKIETVSAKNTQLKAQMQEDGHEPNEMSWLLYCVFFVSIHLHFLSCFGDVPFSLNVLLRIRDIHDTPKELFMAAPIFFIDALVTPLTQLFVGALFICTSETSVDVILNSCAVAFIANIDNWILTLLRHMKTLSGVHDGMVVHVPYNKHFSQVMEQTVCVIPILPVIFTALMIQAGIYLNLPPVVEPL